MSSPLIRRLRLGRAVFDLRGATGLTAEEFAKRAGIARMDVSRLETAARRTDLDKVVACLEAGGLHENDEQYKLLFRIARESLRKGWWETPKFKDVSDRQKRCADVESAASVICHYNTGLMPWMFQTKGYIEARDAVWRADGIDVNPVSGVFRLRRQEAVLHPEGPKIKVLLEEQVIRRAQVESPELMAAQLRHIIKLAETYPQVTVRVLPVDGAFGPFCNQLITFTLHEYSDPSDGTAMISETIADDPLSTDKVEVGQYVRLFARMHDVALPEADSATFIEKHAARRSRHQSK